MTDPIADMLTRIRNSMAVKKSEVSIPASKLKVKLAEIMKQEGYINSYSVNENSKILKVNLKYTPSGKSAISYLQRVSKPGRRVYCGHENLPKILNGLGISVISTSHGLITAREAKRKKIGGEVICQIY